MEGINQGMGKKVFWENVRKQVQINFIQQKNLFIGIYGALMVYTLFITVLGIISFYRSNTIEYYSVFFGYSTFVWTGILCILVLTYQLFSNDMISMYPGNAISRYLGRALSDHIHLFCYLLCVALSYVLQCGLFLLFLRGKAGLDVSVIFDIRYLAVGLLRLGAYGMAYYGAFSLFMALFARLGKWFFFTLVAGIAGFVSYCAIYGPGFMMALWEWLQGDHIKLLPYISIFWVIWLACMLASVVLACHVRCQRIFRKSEYIMFMISVCLGIVGGLAVTGFHIIVESDISEEGRGTKYGEEDLYSSILIRLPEDHAYNMDEEMVDVIDPNSGEKLCPLYQYINNYDNLVYSLYGKSEIADMGMPDGVDLSGVDEEHGLLIFQTHDVRINGQNIYRDLMKDMQKNLRQVEDRNRIKLEYAGNLKTTICFDFFPSADRFLYHGSRDITMKEYYDTQPYLLTTLVLSDDRYAAYEKEMDEEDE